MTDEAPRKGVRVFVNDRVFFDFPLRDGMIFAQMLAMVRLDGGFQGDGVWISWDAAKWVIEITAPQPQQNFTRVGGLN